MTKPAYQRLPGRRWINSSGNASLWIGTDHVVSVASTGFTETYRRFYLKDIGAILIQRTNRGMIWNIVLGSIGGLLGLLAVAILAGGDPSDAGFAYFLLIIFVGPSLLLLVVNLVRGPTCLVRIQTAVQAAEIPAVGRLKAAEKLLARVVPLIRQAQVSGASQAEPAPGTTEDAPVVVDEGETP